jgi:hypothetical protein
VRVVAPTRAAKVQSTHMLGLMCVPLWWSSTVCAYTVWRIHSAYVHPQCICGFTVLVCMCVCTCVRVYVCVCVQVEAQLSRRPAWSELEGLLRDKADMATVERLNLHKVCVYVCVSALCVRVPENVINQVC